MTESWFDQVQERLSKHTGLLLRVSLGAVFVWSGLSKLVSVDGAVGVCTNRAEAIDFVSTLYWVPFDPALFVAIQTYTELALGLLLIVGLRTKLAALCSAALFVIFFALFDFNVVWKNIGLLGASAAILGLPLDAWALDSKLKNRSDA